MLEADENPLQTLIDPLSAALFRRPSRFGVDSAWYGHIPFGMWIVEQTRPRLLVELGTHAGVSYSAFCDAVIEHRLATRCFAVDTWLGDAQAGFYGDEVYADFRRFHDARYQGFSCLLRMTFDDALRHMADGSIDLLHVDGLHTYQAVRHDFEGWLAKLSDRAVVLFHDTNVREGEFGVWRLWAELRRTYPGFEFLHGHGLGVLTIGRNAPRTVQALCSLEQDAAAVDIRERFALLGERWEIEARLTVLQTNIAGLLAQAKARNDIEWRTAAAARERLEMRRDDALQAVERGRQELQRTQQALRGTRHEVEHAQQELQRSFATIEGLQREHEVFVNSTIWRATAPLRQASQIVPLPVRRLLRPGVNQSPQLQSPIPGAATDRLPSSLVHTESGANEQPIGAVRRIVFVSGEPDTPGHVYRVTHYADAAATIGTAVSRMTPAEAAQRGEELAQAQIVVLWRAAWSPDIQSIIAAVRSGNAKLIFDIDDLMFKPELAAPEVIDGIRSQHLSREDVVDHYQRVRQVMAHANACTASTEPLARHVRELQKTTYVLPNGFDRTTLTASRRAVRERHARPELGLVRIGYAAGTLTHQRDFQVASEAVARILRERPECRLVLFRDQSRAKPMLDVLEFPSLVAQADRIEWRDVVPIADLPGELARFDINLAPLEVGNPYCEAKSELKYFEAALADVCTIASPTWPMAHAIRHGTTGMLADTPDDWYATLNMLVEDADLRRRLARAAYLDVLWRYGPRRRADLMQSLLTQLGGGSDAARAFELELRRGNQQRTELPDIPQSEVVFSADALGTAEVTVIIPLYNYAGYVAEALESVQGQTIQQLDLIVVDDYSTDDSLRIARDWAENQARTGRFNRILVLRNQTNQGLARTRNCGFAAAETAYVVPLDADNRLLPDFCARTLAAVSGTDAAFAYTKIQCFGGSDHVICDEEFAPMRFAQSNYIDAMALVAKDAWAEVGGYTHIQHGWEDYDFWCCCAERGMWGVYVPEILAEYRMHDASMLRTVTETRENKHKVVGQLEARHAWLSITERD